MPITRHPPHRSQRALLMHWAPASSSDAHACCAAYRILSSSCGRSIRFCAWLLVRLDGFLSASPLLSTFSASGLLSPVLFEGFSDTMGLSDSLYPFFTALFPQDFQCGPYYNLCKARYRASRFPRKKLPCMHEVSDPAKSLYPSPFRNIRYCLLYT